MRYAIDRYAEVLVEEATQHPEGMASFLEKFEALVTRDGRRRDLPSIYAAAVALYDRRCSVVRVAVKASQPLSQHLRAEIEDSLKRGIGAACIALEETIDPSCGGGISLSVDGRTIDYTVRSRAISLRRFLSSPV